MFDPTTQIELYHVESGKQSMYPTDAIDALTYWPDHWKTAPWTKSDKAQFASKGKDVTATTETPRWRVKAAISISGSLHQAGRMIENYRGKPHANIEPMNEAARTRDKNYLMASATISGIIDRFVAEQARSADEAYRAERSRGVPERLHAPSLP